MNVKFKILAGLFFLNYLSANVDFVIYSYDRPMQLYSLLESMYKYIQGGIGDLHVIYRVTNKEYDSAYADITKDFPLVKYYKQGSKPQLDFKPLAMKCAFESPNKYVSFVVDDIIVKDYFNLNRCIDFLEETKAYCFLLRLGKNTRYCYTMQIESGLPRGMKKVDADVYSWVFEKGLGDWNFPSNNDMTIYRKDDIKEDLGSIDQIYFTNTFYEPYWCSKTNRKLKGLCFKSSKIVNICMNIVILEQPSHAQFSDNWSEKEMDNYSARTLLNKFKKGFKFDISSLYQINNISAHMEYKLGFVLR